MVYKFQNGGSTTQKEVEYFEELDPITVKPNPVKIQLTTEGITKDTPITHSSLHAYGNGVYFLVSKGSDDPSYNFFTANCSDATGDVIGQISGNNLTKGITTPYTIKHAVKKLYGDSKDYKEKRMPKTTFQEFTVPWYEARLAQDVVNQQRFDLLKHRIKQLNRESELEGIANHWNETFPKLQWHFDENGNIVKIENKYLENGGVIKLQKAGILSKAKRLVTDIKGSSQLTKVIKSSQLKEPVIGYVDRTTNIPKLSIHDPITNELLLSMRSKNPSNALSSLNGIEIVPKEINLPEPPSLRSTPQEAATTYHFDGRMPFSKPISEAERLGIPKALRSSPKSLEDSYYWGYKQWNDKYNAAIESGNIQEGRRLYNLHEARNAPNTQVHGDYYHGTNNTEYNIMDSTKNPGRTVGAGEKTSNFFSDTDLANVYLIDAQGMGTWYQGPGRLIRARLNIKNPYIFDYEGAKFNGNGGTAKVYNYLTKTFKDFQNGQLKYFPAESDFIDSWRAQNKYLGKIVPGRDYTYSTSKVKPEIADLVDNIIDRNVYDGAIIKNINEIDSPVTDYVTFTPNQVKLSNVITYDDYGNMIPIVKRHNYHNPDMRYKQGGIIKLQKAGVLPKAKRLLSIAEKLGIPKGERLNPKSLEEPYYWGYQQWNNKYNSAVQSGNLEEVQRLRDLHFKTKAPDTKAIDENGELMHLYHGTGKKGIVSLDASKRGVNTGSGTYTDPITNEIIPIDSENTFSFSSSKNTATSYRNLARWQEIEERMRYYDNIDAVVNNKLYSGHTLDEKRRQAQRNFIDNVLSPKLGYDLRKAINFKTLTDEQVQKLNAQIKALRIKMKDVPDARAISNQRNNLSKDIDNLGIIERNKANFLSGENISDWNFDDYNLVFASGNGNKNKGEIYEIISKDNKNGGYLINGKPITEETFGHFLENAKESIRQNKIALEADERLGGYDTFGDVIDVYANIKNPLVHNYNYSAFPDTYLVPAKKGEKDVFTSGYTKQLVRPLVIDGKKVPTGYVAARQVRKAMRSGNDAVVYKNIVDPFLSDTYGVFDPKTVKFSSAITRTDSGEIIPIVKRDNFHNIDMRYKQGGVIKAQEGTTIENPRKTAYIQSLDKFISENPTVGNLNTADFRDFLVGLVGHESSYNSRAKQGSYYGWYQTKIPSGTSEVDQHKLAFDHLNHLFKNVITKADLNRASELGIEQAPLLLKYWNQENRVNNYLWNNMDSADGLGTKISEYGNDLMMPLDTTKYAMDNLYGDYEIKEGDNWFNIQKRVRMPGRNYTTMGRDLWNMNKLNGVPFGNLKIGQTFNFGKEPEKPKTKDFSYTSAPILMNYPNTYPNNYVEYKPSNTIKYAKGDKLVYKPYNGEETDYDLSYKPFVNTEQKIADSKPLSKDLMQVLYTKPEYDVEAVSVYNPMERQSTKVEESTPAPTPVVKEEPKVEDAIVDTPEGQVVYKTQDMNVGNMSEVIDFLVKNGVKFRITSGYRPGAISKSGKPSYHSYGNAIDITPVKGEDFAQLRKYLNKPIVVEGLNRMGIRILDETTKEMMAKTGATGPHFHLELHNNT